MRCICYFILLLVVAVTLQIDAAYAQIAMPGAPVNINNAPQRDTTNRSSSVDWHDESVRVSFTKAGSLQTQHPDTTLHTFHRRRFSQPWHRDLGNSGSASRSLFFRPDNEGKTGFSSGYHVFDVYRFKADSLLYFNTTRPYTSFSYQLGSKLEQLVNILHTQNIKPNWNFAVNYQKITSPGYYQIQRVNNDNASLSTSYQSKDQHYSLKGAVVYNVQQQDENGGITADSFLSQSKYSERNTIPVAFENPGFSDRRSSVTTRLRDFNILLQHGYTWGRRDTVYSADSTQYYFELVPRFRITHRMELGSEKTKLKYQQPDSLTMSSFFGRQFASDDSVYSAQQWVWFDNRVMLEGFLGKRAQQLLFNAGIGNRLDNFSTDYATGRDRTNNVSNYIVGELKKEALKPGQWSYNANLQFYITGPAAGNFLLNASVGKDIGEWGNLQAGFGQQLSAAPYNARLYKNNFYTQETSLSNESITQLYITLRSRKLGLSGGVKNYVLTNYIYLADTLERVSNGRLDVRQYGTAFNLTQAWVQKAFYVGHFVLDNELFFQQIAGNAPIEVPTFLGRHQLSYENYLFNNALKIATGIEVRYHSAYKPMGYSPFYNRFYYQAAYTTNNNPEAAFFFNFKVKRFRAYLMGDQLQRLFTNPNVPTPGYPTQDIMIRFGFDWVMIN